MNYHMVSDEPLPHIQYRYAYKSSRQFENDLIYLKKHFHPITYDQLLEHRLNGDKLKPRSLILTFDDGFAECCTIVSPLLEKYRIPCMFFITTGFIDNQAMALAEKSSLCLDQLHQIEHRDVADLIARLNKACNLACTDLSGVEQLMNGIGAGDEVLIDRLCRVLDVDVAQYLAARRPYLSTGQIDQLKQAGFTIGAHSLKHQDFRQLSDHEIVADITASCDAIRAITGEAQIPFAFPHSADGVSRHLLKEIRSRNKTIGLFFDTNGIQEEGPFLVSRMCGDSPRAAKTDRSNLRVKITRAYLDEIRSRISHFA